MEGARILVVDDDASIRDAVCEYLGRHGFRVRGADGGAAMDRRLAAEPADLVVLDLMMPGEDGLSICRRLRPDGPAVLMLSAMGETTDRVVGLEIGADDYLAKPFEPRELLARVRAVLRRRGAAEAASDGPVLLFAGWRLDLIGREVTNPAGQSIALTGGEFVLLQVFAEHPRRVLSRNQLMDMARRPDADSFDRAVDLQVSRLRRKLDDGGGAELIETVRGEGYRFTVAVRRA
ncbi:MAG: response regulator [Proteobacteria bacterium]|nr:response regulator [Pseudomonadota bacterium]MBW3617901.1 response regulator [Pseudomonadota bacterium]